jgi:tRNA threonylcarbamoyladenosine biosynthesis protein TsaB
LITLGIDTCEARGSVALLKGGTLVSLEAHETTEDYSTWLLPAVRRCLLTAGAALEDVNLLAVATGPGSFTGLRVGLTTVKAWSELYGKPVVGVSRLEVMARTGGAQFGYVAASFDAQRGQVFGGLYKVASPEALDLIEQEMVIGPGEFVKWVSERTGGLAVRWITLDPQIFEGLPEWKEYADRGSTLIHCPSELAAGIAALGEERARQGRLSDALQLDANYVRRSDAEIFWKDPGSHGR